MLDGLVTVSAVPSKTVVTFDDDVIFDVTYHNGTTEAIHVAAHQCGVKLSTRDPAMNAVMFGDWDRTAAGLLALIDGGQSTDGLSWATAVGHAPTPIPLSQYHLCPPFDLAPGSDHHELVHWAVRAGERTLTGTIYARAQFSWMRTSEEGVFVTAPLIAITLVEDPLRIPSRDAAAAAAVAAIVERNIAPPGLPPEQLRLGGWYHAGVWTFAVYPSYWSPSWVHVDAATAQVIGVQTASAAP